MRDASRRAGKTWLRSPSTNDADAVVFDLEDLTPAEDRDRGGPLVGEIAVGAVPKPVRGVDELRACTGDVIARHSGSMRIPISNCATSAPRSSWRW